MEILQAHQARAARRRSRLRLRVVELATLAGTTQELLASFENGEPVDRRLKVDVEVALALTELALEEPELRTGWARLLPGEPYEGWAAT